MEKNAERDLTKEEIGRYGRQLIMPEIGTKGQKKLVSSSVLIIGAGGLGSPSSLYLAGAGIGRIGIVDFDHVEMSNLHRQVIHRESTVGISKALSAKRTIEEFNSSIKVIAYPEPFTTDNALELVDGYDVVLDASDNVATRYLINDACVIKGKPLVSGAALRMEGQITVYHHQGGPCYRCLYPSPPPKETVTDCSNGGVLGVVPGIIGSLQALEAIKLITGSGDTLSQKLLLFDAMSMRFTNVKLRPRNPSCQVCGDNPSITSLIDYAAFCGSSYNDKPCGISVLDPIHSISWKDYKEIEKESSGILLDVRDPLQFEICSLPSSTNISLEDMKRNPELVKLIAPNLDTPIYCLCRRGNNSQLAVKYLQSKGYTQVKNLLGGLQSWARDIDPNFPVY